MAHPCTLIASVAIWALVLSSTSAFSSHGHWLDHYRDAQQRPCCSANNDCRVVRARILSQDAASVTVEIDGVLLSLPGRSVHISEDAADWACVVPPQALLSKESVRCLFIAAQM